MREFLVWKSVIKEMPPPPAPVCVSVRVAHDANMAIFVSLSASCAHTLAKSSLKVTPGFMCVYWYQFVAAPTSPAFLCEKHLFWTYFPNWWNWCIIRGPVCVDLCETGVSGVYLCRWVGAKALFLCQRGLCARVSFFLLGFDALWLFWRSEMTPWERGQSSPPPLHLLLSISPSLLSCILISVFCCSWYVDFIKFSSGWVTEKTGGDEGSHPLFAAFIFLSSFIPARGHWS